VFPWSWLVEQEIEQGPHPVVRHHVLKHGVEALIKVGVLLARAPDVAHAVSGRLRSAAGYADCVAELRVGLLMSEAGARIQFEPNGRDVKGPDWYASWSDVEVALEVKHPDLSDWAKKISAVETAMLFALQRHFVAPQPTVGAFLNFRMSPILLEALTRSSEPELEAIDRIARTASDALVAQLPRPTKAALIDVNDFGTFEIELGATGEPAYHWSGYGLSPDDEYEGKRLARILHKAAKQFEHEQALRVAVLHIGRNGLVMNHGLHIARMLHTERWARSIDAVLLFDAFDANFERREYVIPGPVPRPSLQRLVAYLAAVKRAP